MNKLRKEKQKLKWYPLYWHKDEWYSKYFGRKTPMKKSQNIIKSLLTYLLNWHIILPVAFHSSSIVTAYEFLGHIIHFHDSGFVHAVAAALPPFYPKEKQPIWSSISNSDVPSSQEAFT